MPDNIDIDELAKSYGIGADNKAPVNNDIDELAKVYGIGKKTDVPTPVTRGYTTDELPDNIPRPGAIPTPTNELPGSKTPLRLAKEFVTDLPTEWKKTAGKRFRKGAELANEGLQDIYSNKPFTGLAKGFGGTLQAAYSPVEATAKSFVGTPAVKFAGPEFGEKVTEALVGGLPVSKIIKAATLGMPANKAMSTLIDAIGKENIAGAVQRLKENPRLSFMDVSPEAKELGQKLATDSGYRNKFEKFVNETKAGAKEAVEGAYSHAMGGPVNVKEKIDQLKQAVKDVGRKEINPVIENTGPVDIGNVIANIDAKLKPGVTSVISTGEPLPLGDIEKPLEGIRKLLTNGKSIRTDADSLHKIQASIRAKADDLLNSSSGQERQIGYALMKTRNDIVNAIDKASGGKYKPTLAKIRDEYHVEDAFEKGQLITRNRPSEVTDRPEFWKEWVDNASPHQLDAAREGARIAVDQQINGFRNASGIKGTEIPQVEFNKQKLELLFDKKELDKMFKTLQDERDIAQRNQDLIHGSQTAMRMKASKALEFPSKAELGKLSLPIAIGEMAAATRGYAPFIATGAVAGLKGLSSAAHFTKTKLAEGMHNELVDVLTATGSEREKLIETLSQHIPKPKSSVVQRAHDYALPVFGLSK